MSEIARRRFLLAAAAAGGLAAGPRPAHAAEETVDLELPGGPSVRPLTSVFPEKGRMILQRLRPPLLETPFEVFDAGVFTPNHRFYVRWHWPAPARADPQTFRLAVRGAVERPLLLSLDDLRRLPETRLAAVNQCAGNSRGFAQPRVPGAQWGNGAMGNALWSGVALGHVLDLAGVKAGASTVRFKGLDATAAPGAPQFMKSLDLDHARNGEVMIATRMNGAELPLLNGFPARLVVPGWYSTYWVKALSDVEVLIGPDDNFWMASAYRIPDTAGGDVKPGEKGFATRPIGRMNPRSFFTNVRNGSGLRPASTHEVRGLAFGGDCGVAQVEISDDEGGAWKPADLGPDEGVYSFRRWRAAVRAPAAGPFALKVRCVNTRGERQPLQPTWNPSGYMLNAVERVALEVGRGRAHA